MANGALILLAAAGLALTHPAAWRKLDRPIEGAPASLKTLATAEANFRSNDRDGSKIVDFWTLDVAALYGIPPPPRGPRAWMNSALAWMSSHAGGGRAP